MATPEKTGKFLRKKRIHMFKEILIVEHRHPNTTHNKGYTKLPAAGATHATTHRKLGASCRVLYLPAK